MKFTAPIVTLFVIALLFPVPNVAALSCLPTDMYLDTVVGDEETIIFTGVSTARQEAIDYTSEVITVSDAHQGYIENSVMVYHEKHTDWGYLCNTGPADVDTESTYIATRNNVGQYDITMRLDVDSELATELKATLTKESIAGEVVTLTPADRKQQILTTISDLFKQITLLISEYRYWSNPQ